jgi:hypothetical protein
MSLVYLVHKPHVLGGIARWLLLFLEYDYTVVYKPGKTHVVVDVLSKLPNVIESSGVVEQTTNASLFFTKPKWLNDVNMLLQIGQMEKSLPIGQKQ